MPKQSTQSSLGRNPGSNGAPARAASAAARKIKALLKRHIVIERFLDDEANHVRRSVFSGFYLDDHCRGRSRRITISRFPIFEWEKGKKDKISLFSLRPLLKDNSTKLLDSIVDSVSPDCDDIYLCRHNIGETYINLSLIEEAIKKNGSINPTLVVRKKEYISLYRMFIPKSAYLVHVPILRTDLDCHVVGQFYYKGKRIFSGRKDILDHLRKDKSESGLANFVDFMRADMGVGVSAEMLHPRLRETSRLSLQQKMESISLNMDKFFLLTPEASTISELGENFWSGLAAQLFDRGYEVFVNRVKPAPDNASLKSIPLDLEEVYLLAMRAKGIIGVASGLNVLLSSTATPMDILYTDSGGEVSAQEMIELFSMSNLAGCSPERVREYDTEKMSAETIISQIISRLPRPQSTQISITQLGSKS